MSNAARNLTDTPPTWQNTRLKQEATLFDEIMSNTGVKRAIARIRTHYSGYGFGHKRHLLAHSVRLTPAILPELYKMKDECQEALAMSEPIELFVSPMAGLNAYCYKPPIGHNIVVLSSQLVEKFTMPELKFVIGHELGHAIFNHAAIPMPIVANVGDAAGRIVSLDTALKLFKWSRAAEFSADRLGYHCANNVEAAISAFFKLASGLEMSITMDHTKSFLSQISALTLSPLARPNLDPRDSDADCFQTHPFSPLRVRSLMRYAAHLKGEISDSELNDLLEADLSLMDPDYLQDRTPASETMRELLFYASVALSHADGEIKASEMDALATLLGRDAVETKGNLAGAQQKIESLAKFVLANSSLVDRTRLIQHLVVIALADGRTDDREVEFLELMAGRLEVNPAIIAQTIAAANNPLD
jgi:uncharacterized tellurite resistance protein B-like protein